MKTRRTVEALQVLAKGLDARFIAYQKQKAYTFFNCF